MAVLLLLPLLLAFPFKRIPAELPGPGSLL
jgi:hypothetical protein